MCLFQNTYGCVNLIYCEQGLPKTEQKICIVRVLDNQIVEQFFGDDWLSVP
ncbi:MAG: hypothetical protein JKY89_01040 [Immundisolibacteraceae bacterium]|nr:hypothetical protein [Immundisolibacteraceae bacterium]